MLESAARGPLGEPTRACARARLTPLVPFRAVLSEREAEVVEVTPVEIHGVPYADLIVKYPDGVVASARIGRESIPVDLAVGERVLVQAAMSVIVGARRA